MGYEEKKCKDDRQEKMRRRGGRNRNRGGNRRRTVSGMRGELLSVYRAPAVLCCEVPLVPLRGNMVL